MTLLSKDVSLQLALDFFLSRRLWNLSLQNAWQESGGEGEAVLA